MQNILLVMFIHESKMIHIREHSGYSVTETKPLMLILITLDHAMIP
jgi:hypothetical protein